MGAISHEDMSRRVYPDFCPGWLYVTTPKVGLAMAEASLVTPSDPLMRVARLDDIFVAGFLRERVPGVKVQQFHDGLIGDSWKTWNGFFPQLLLTLGQLGL